MQAMMIAPATMLAFNGHLHLNFDDFEEVQEHPMAQVAMVNLKQLLEQALGKPFGDF
jgi:hypothetical protein